jgi:tetrahydromethanopterin S-methyltransferase subunit G
VPANHPIDPQEFKQIQLDIYKLKSDLDRVDGLIDRLDSTIEKLTEVSASVSQLLAVQMNRMEYLEKKSELLSKGVVDADKQLVIFDKEMHKGMENNQAALLVEMKLIRDETQRKLDKLDTKLEFVERWMWVVSGGAAVVGFILSKLTEKFF